MAAADDRGALGAAAGRGGGSSGLRWLALALGLALLAVAVLQVRQFVLLQQARSAGSDYIVLTFHQFETEYLRLREAWAEQLRAPGTAATPATASAANAASAAAGDAALQLRYEVFVSRIGLIEAPGPQRLLAAHPELREVLARVQAFIARADEALGPTPVRAPDAAFLAALQPELLALGGPLHALSLAATHRVGEQISERSAVLAQLGRVNVALTGVLGLGVLAFAVMALRQVRALRRRRAELEALTQQLQHARATAEAASEAKSAFLANMSHEIRTPFHGLMGMLSLLRETGLTPRQVDYLRTATESADHLLAILNDILDMSQLESGRMTLAPAPVELRALLRDVEALMRPQATARTLALHIDADPQVPEQVLADPTRVKQILFNLLSNAIKFTERGAVVLDLRVGDAAARGAAPGEELQFVVTDTGVGIEPAALQRLFTRFGRGDASTTRRHAGAGLGLEISRTLARLMGGDITVRSTPGEGSRFTLHLPLQPVPAGAVGPSAAASPAEGRALQVLVAEDHPVNLQYMAALLENLGHRAHFCADGEEAVAAARARRFDIVLMDLHMPLMDGVAATRAIRALPDPERSTVPIVGLTADALTETRERCLVAGMNDFLTKPVSPQKLATALRRLFGSPGGTAGGEVAPGPSETAAPTGGTSLVDAAALQMALQAMPRERLAGMIEAFLAQGPATVQRLRTAVRDAELLELRVNAHAARGAALNLGLSALAATAEALHEGAAHLPAHEIARLVQRYEELLPATRAAVQGLGLGLGLLVPAAATADAAPLPR